MLGLPDRSGSEKSYGHSKLLACLRYLLYRHQRPLALFYSLSLSCIDAATAQQLCSAEHLQFLSCFISSAVCVPPGVSCARLFPTGPFAAMSSAPSPPLLPAAATRRRELRCSHCHHETTRRSSGLARAPESGRLCFPCRNKARVHKPRPQMQIHSWQRFPRSAHSAQLARRWCSLQSVAEADEHIRGNVRSFDCLVPRYSILQHAPAVSLRLRKFSESLVTPLVEDTEVLLRTQLAAIVPAVFSAEAQQQRPYFLNACKLLWSTPGEGQQKLHYDVSARCLAYSRYSCILYCTPCYHTAMPLAPAASLRGAFNTGEALTGGQLAANQAIFRPVPFVSKLVPAGSGMLFNTGVAHYGVENVMTKQTRIVVFALFCPRMDKNPDQKQRFPYGVSEPMA